MTRLFFLKSVFQFLKTYKKRTILSMLGVLFGIFSLVAVGNISSAMNQKVKETLDKFGPNLLIIRAGEVHVTGRGVRQFSTAQTLKLRDAIAIKQFIKVIKEIVPIVEINYPLRYKQQITTMKIVGATSNIAQVRNLKLLEGHFYGSKEEKYLSKKVVLGYEAWKTLFEDKNAFGKTILIRRVPCQVIGVLAEKGTDLAGDNLDQVVYLPLKTVLRRLLNQDYISALYLQAKEGINLENLKEEIRKLLRKQHGLTTMEKDDFSIYSLEDIAKTKQKGLDLVSVLSKMAAIISFTVGGLGIFAVMLLSVTERQREIGIRRAVGAKRIHILWQFLGEAVFISFLGGMGGIGLGSIIALIVSLVANLPIIFNVIYLILAMGISLALGIMAGSYPAFLAASSPPLKALRQ